MRNTKRQVVENQHPIREPHVILRHVTSKVSKYLRFCHDLVNLYAGPHSSVRSPAERQKAVFTYRIEFHGDDTSTLVECNSIIFIMGEFNRQINFIQKIL